MCLHCTLTITQIADLIPIKNTKMLHKKTLQVVLGDSRLNYHSKKMTGLTQRHQGLEEIPS